MKRTTCILFFALILGIPVTRAQASVSGVKTVDFFIIQAWTDARYEQTVRLGSEREEIDFWTDQRAFERELYRREPGAYSAYVRAKGQAYARHQANCGTACGHGDFYFRQASFYAQSATDSEGNLWIFSTPESGGGLIAARPQH